MPRRFHFPLETLLRVRRLRQRQAERRLAAIQADLHRLDQMRSEIVGEIETCQTRLRERQSGRISPTDLTSRQAWIVHLRRCLFAAEQQRVDVTQKVREQQQNVQAARTATKMLEKLRVRREDEHRRTEQRREQHTAEELARQLHVLRPDDGLSLAGDR